MDILHKKDERQRKFFALAAIQRAALELDDHQREWALRVLSEEAPSYPLFGEAGTGKTPPMCLVAVELIRRHGGKAVFIVPTRLVWNWEYELRRICPQVIPADIVVMNGNKSEREMKWRYINLLKPHYIIVGYKAATIHQQEFQAMEDVTVLVLDEAHYIKNHGIQRTRACKSINAKFRFALTGTPITNRPNDLWSVMHFLEPGKAFMRKSEERPPLPGKSCPSKYKDYYQMRGCEGCRDWDKENSVCRHGANIPGVPSVSIRYRKASPTWKNYDYFVGYYCAFEWGRYGRKITGPNPRRLDELHRLLDKSRATRWRADEVLKLKPLKFEHVRLEASPAERKNYLNVASGIIATLESDQNWGHFRQTNPLAIMTYLRQATTLPPTVFAATRTGLLDEMLDSPLVRSDLSTKVDWLIDFLKGLNGDGKVLVYGHWIALMDYVSAKLEDAGIGHVGIYGRHNKDPRSAQRIMEQFRDDPKLQVIIGNESMSEGLNFQAASHVVFLHLPWVPKDVVQFIRRARRRGQTRAVIVWFPSLRGTIDEEMASTLMEKQTGIDSILDPDFAGQAGMFDISSREGLINLIRRSMGI